MFRIPSTSSVSSIHLDSPKFSENASIGLGKAALFAVKKLAPHRIVNPCDSRKVAERIAAELLHVLRIVARHQSNCDTMRQLQKKGIVTSIRCFSFILPEDSGFFGKKNKLLKFSPVAGFNGVP